LVCYIIHYLARLMYFYYLVVKLDENGNESDQLVAIKVYDKIKLIDKTKRGIVKREIGILRKLDHPNIIKLMRTVETNNCINLVVEYAGNLTLRKHLDF